jgi:DNA-binding transcriptional MerR regulator
MKNLSDQIEKKYYSIGEVAQLLDVAPSLIRFWESQFDSIRPRKSKKGVRQYTKEDITKLENIYFLVKKRGFTLQGAREMLVKKGDAGSDMLQVIKDLVQVRDFFSGLKDKIAVLPPK